MRCACSERSAGLQAIIAGIRPAPLVQKGLGTPRICQWSDVAVTLFGTQVVPPKSPEQLEIQAVHRIRQRLISDRTQLVNQMRGLLAEHGVVTHLRCLPEYGREADLVFAGASVAQARHLDGSRPDPGQHLAFRQMPVAHQTRPPVCELILRKGCQKRLDQLARPAPITSVSESGTIPDGWVSRVMVSSSMWHIPFSHEN